MRRCTYFKAHCSIHTDLMKKLIMKLTFDSFVHSRRKIPQNWGGGGEKKIGFQDNKGITKTWQSVSGTTTPADRLRDYSKIPSTPAYVELPVIGVKNRSWVIELWTQQHFCKWSEEWNGPHVRFFVARRFLTKGKISQNPQKVILQFSLQY